MSIFTTKPLKVTPSNVEDGITLTTPSTGAGVFSSWVVFSASTPAPWTLAGFVAIPTSIQDYEIEVGIGPTGFEQSIGNFFVGSHESPANSEWLWLLPVPVGTIPTGSQVSLRVRGTAVSDTLKVSLLYYENFDSDYFADFSTFRYGYSPLISGSTSNAAQTHSATAWANTAYTQLSPGFFADSYVVGVSFATGLADNLAVELDIAGGAPGSEVVLTTLSIAARQQGQTNIWLPAPLLVTANTILSFRTRSANTVAGRSCLATLLVIAGPSKALVTQVSTEILNQATSVSTRVTQSVVEILSQPIPAAQITQYVVEVLSQPTAPARVTQAVVELLSSNPPAIPPPSGILNVIWMGDTAGTIWVE